jgi:hypothetical protein
VQSGQGKRAERTERTGRRNFSLPEKSKVEDVDDVEIGGKKCSSLAFLLCPLVFSALSVFFLSSPD